MLREYAEKALKGFSSEKRERTIHRARTALNAGYRLYAEPLYLAAVPFFKLSRSTSVYGTSIPRFYWNHFLQEHRARFRGHALEIDTAKTVRRVGGVNIEKADVINIDPGPEVTIVADLSSAWNVASEEFDVFLHQFAIHFMDRDLEALYHSLRILKPGGALVINFPCVSGYPHLGMGYGEDGGYIHRWYTPVGVERMLNRLVPPSAYRMRVYGNRHAIVSYVSGIGAEAVPKRWLLKEDPHWPLLICAVVTRPAPWQPDFVPPRDEIREQF